MLSFIIDNVIVTSIHFNGLYLIQRIYFIRYSIIIFLTYFSSIKIGISPSTSVLLRQMQD